jgi:NADPH2:quinone reductase
MSNAIPAMMTAIEISRPGGPEVLTPVQRPTPAPGPGEVLVKVAFAGVNRPDALQRAGAYPPPPGASDIPGLEFSGVVVGLGEGAAGFSIGDQVCALASGGGYAQYAVAPASNALPLPHGVTLEQAGGTPETYFTVWTNVFERGGLEPGQTLLVHGGASGIGTTAIQLARAFGSRVYATAGSADKCVACIALGANGAFDYRTQDFVAEIKRATDGRGADVILDMVGGDYVERNQEAAAPGGRIVQIAFLKGSKVTLDLRRIMLKRLVYTGSTLRSRPVGEKAAIARALRERVWPLMAQGQCLPVIDSVFRLEDAAQAHARMESSAHVGKILLKP